MTDRHVLTTFLIKNLKKIILKVGGNSLFSVVSGEPLTKATGEAKFSFISSVNIVNWFVFTEIF